jgi:phosphoketolase
MEGYGYAPRFVSGSDPTEMHQQMAATLDEVVAEIADLQRRGRQDGEATPLSWPMIVLRTAKGTTTTPFDMVMLNGLDRFHLVTDVVDRVPGLAQRAAARRQHMSDERLRHGASGAAPEASGRPRCHRSTGPELGEIAADARAVIGKASRRSETTLRTGIPRP